MAVRPIDGNVLIEWFRPYLHTGEAIPADVVIEDIRSMPALTPKNEPLALEQLREMDGDPVYIIVDGVEPLKMWVLVEVDDVGDIYLTNNLGGRSSYEETRNLYKFKLYRRPPEGENG